MMRAIGRIGLRGKDVLWALHSDGVFEVSRLEGFGNGFHVRPSWTHLACCSI